MTLPPSTAPATPATGPAGAPYHTDFLGQKFAGETPLAPDPTFPASVARSSPAPEHTNTIIHSGSADTLITGKTDLSVYCLLSSCPALLLLIFALQLLVLVTNALILTLHRLEEGGNRRGDKEGEGRSARRIFQILTYCYTPTSLIPSHPHTLTP